MKNMSKTTKSSLITYGLIVLAYVVAEIFMKTGHMTSLLKGLLVPLCVYAILAVSLNLTVGILGELSLGHAGFMCVGAFTSAVFTKCMMHTITVPTVRFLLALLVGVVCAGICGVLIGIPVLRLRGDYLAIVTLAFGEIIKNLVNVIYLGRDSAGFHFSMKDIMALNMEPDGEVIIKGAQGITGAPTDSNFTLGIILLLITLFIVLNLIHSRAGRAIMSIRDNRIAAESIGINITKYKILAFSISAALAGAALTMPTGLNKVFAAETKQTATSDNNSNVAHITGHRILGKGKAAFEVSALGFGVMGMTYNRSQHPDKKQCIRLLHEAVDRGVTLFDTAIIYGPLTNENLAREALAEFKGRINVTTKFGHEVIDGKGTGRQDSRPETIRRYCEESLRRLRLDSLPMFYQHRADPNTPAEEVASTIADLMKEGKVQHWGMCEVNAETIHKAHAVCPLTAIQSEYHLMHRLVEENGVLDACRELGIGFVPYSPLNRGFLGGCINEYTVFDPNNDNRQTLPRFQAEAMRANTRIVNVLQAFGRTRGMTSTQVALGWLLQKAPWIVPIPGTTKLAHLEENLRTLEFTLSPEEWKELENAVATIPVVGDRYNAEQQRQVGR